MPQGALFFFEKIFKNNKNKNLFVSLLIRFFLAHKFHFIAFIFLLKNLLIFFLAQSVQKSIQATRIEILLVFYFLQVLPRSSDGDVVELHQSTCHSNTACEQEHSLGDLLCL